MKPLKDYSYLKGFNYSLTREEYDHDVFERNMGYAQKITLNSCRLFSPISRYLENREKYLADMLDLVRTAWAHGISTTPILLMPYYVEGQENYTVRNRNSNEMPGCFLPENYGIGEAYVRDMVNLLKDEPGLLFWDIMNEPSWVNGLVREKDPAEKAKKYDMIWKFVRHFIGYVRELDPVNALGVGHTFIEDTELSQIGDMVDILIFHDYLETRSRVDAVYRRAVELGQKYGKPILNNETGCLCRANPYDVELEMCQKYNVGYYLFELMVEPKGRLWSRVHGIFYPDGTVRDPSIVAGIMGCFRNRSETTIYPDVNMEGHGDKAIAFAKEALDRRAPQEDLLEAAEYIANLLEAGELVPMAYPPTAKILAWRRNPADDVNEVRAFLYDLIEKLRKACEIV